MKKVFKWSLAGVVVLAALTAVVLYNPNLAKGPLEHQLGRLAGFPVKLAGDIELAIGRVTEISVADLHIKAPDWSAQNDLVVIDQLFLSLNTSSLFDEIVIVNSLHISGLQTNLETGSDGQNNWQSAGHQASDKSTAAPGVVFLDVRLNDFRLKHLDQTGKNRQDFYIQTLSQRRGQDDMLDIIFNGSLNDRPVDFNGVVGPFDKLLMGKEIIFDGHGNFGNLEIRSKGLIDDLAKPRRPQFELRIQGQNIDEITAMLGVDDLGSGDFFFDAIGGEVESHYEAGINGQIGDVTLDASVRANDLASLNELDLTLAANGPSLGAFTRVLGIEDWPDEPFSIKGDINRVGSTLNVSRLTSTIGGTEFLLDGLLTNFPDFDAGRLRLSVVGDEVEQFRQLLNLPGIVTGPFEVHGKLDISPQEVELLNLDMKTAFGQLVLTGTLGAAPSYDGSNLRLYIDGRNARELMSIFDIDVLPEKPFKLDTQFETRDNGLYVKHGVLVTIEEERLELGGFLSFDPGSLRTDIKVRMYGQHPSRLLHRFVGGVEFSDSPYDMGGRIHVTEQGVQLQDINLRFIDAELSLNGQINRDDQLLGTHFDFQLQAGDIASLGAFTALHDALEIFVPGQPYRAGGQLMIVDDGWRLNNVMGKIGETTFDIGGLLSNQPSLVGSQLRFSINGSNLPGLLVDRYGSDLPGGAFTASGQLSLSTDTFSIHDFSFETEKARANIDLELGWPLDHDINADFNVDVQGDDVRQLMVRAGAFEPSLLPFRFKADGNKQGQLISLDYFDVKIGDLIVDLQGNLEDSDTGENIDLVFSAKSTDLSTLGRVNGNPLPAMAMNLTADLVGNTREFSMRNLTGNLADSIVNGSLDVSLQNPRPIFLLNVQSDYFDIRPFLDLAGSSGNDAVEITASKKRLIPQIVLPLDAMAVADATIDLEVAELRHRTDSVKNLKLEAALQAGALDVPRLSLEDRRGQLEARFSVTPTDTHNADVQVDLSAEEVIFNLSKQQPDRLSHAPAADIEFHASGNGSNLQELAGSMSGSLYIGSDGGVLENLNLNILDKFIFEEVLKLIMPESDPQADMVLKCAAAMLEIEDGRVKTNPAVTFTTDRITVVSKGTLNLKNERMKLNFNSTPNKALNISAGELFNPYIQVGGTLSEPDIGIDTSNALLHGGAAIGSAGLSILAKGVIDRVGSTFSLCEQIKEQARQ